MTNTEYKICMTQGGIFKYAALQGYEMESFAKHYLTSEFCKEAFDTAYSGFQLETPQECADFFLPEIGQSLSKTSNKQDEEEAYYVGLMYRYLYFVTGISSAELVSLIPYKEICKYFINSHLRTENFVAEDICEDYGLEIIDGKLEL